MTQLRARFLPLPLCLIALPFVFSHATIDPFHALRWTLLAFGAAAALAMLAGRTAVSLLPGPVQALIALWLAASLLSWIPALDKAEAAWQTIRDAAWAAWFLAALGAARRYAGLTVLLRRAALLTAAVGASVAIGQYWSLWLPGDGLGYGPGGLQGNRNLLASLQLLLAPWIAWGLADERGIWRIAAWISWSGFAYVLAVTQCRAAWLGSAVMAVSLGLMAWTSRTRVMPSRSVLAATGIVCAAFLFHGLCRPAMDTRVGSLARAASLADASEASAAQRLTLWAKTGKLIAAYPGLGVGGGNWKQAVLQEGLGGTLWPDMEQTETRPYNDWLWTASGDRDSRRLVLAGVMDLRRAARSAFVAAGRPGCANAGGILVGGADRFRGAFGVGFSARTTRTHGLVGRGFGCPHRFRLPGPRARARTRSRAGILPRIIVAFAFTARATGAASLWRWRNEAVMKRSAHGPRPAGLARDAGDGARLDRVSCDLNTGGFSGGLAYRDGALGARRCPRGRGRFPRGPAFEPMAYPRAL